MPYIKKTEREHLVVSSTAEPTTSGELNYQLTQVCLKFLGGVYNYRDLNEVIGALECCKLEFYRRLAAPYEDKKIAENGDVYP